MTRITADLSQPRGIRNHNPGNLRRTGDAWQGLRPVQDDPAFFQFAEAKWGIRALARTLITHQDKYGCRQAADFVRRWAPPIENDTAAYVQAVEAYCAANGVGGAIDTHSYFDLKPLVEAIIRHENGQQPYTPAQIDAGLVLAGIEPPAVPLAATRTVKGGQTAAVGTTGVAVVTTLADQAKEAVEPAAGLLVKLGPYLGPAKWVFIGLIVIGLAYMLFARWDDRRRGLR